MDPIAPWYATCIQMNTEILWPTTGEQEKNETIAKNIATAVDLVEQAMLADPPPALILLPEYAFTGQPNGGTVAQWLELGTSEVPGPMTEPFSELARKHGIYIGGNQFEYDPEWPDRFFNTSWLIAPSGEIVLRYRRVHTAMWCSPHDVWDDYLTRYGWDGVWPVVDTPLGRIGMIPCGEIMVSEVIRTMALRGTEVLLHATWETRSLGQDAAKVVAAAANGMYVVSTNVAASHHLGEVENRPSGDDVGSGSRIIAPNGEILAIEEDHVTSIDVRAEIDVERVRALRADLSMANPLLRLRIETIAPTYAETSIYPPNAFLELPLTDYAQISTPATLARGQLGLLAGH